MNAKAFAHRPSIVVLSHQAIGAENHYVLENKSHARPALVTRTGATMGILESFVPPQQPDVRVDSQQLIGPPAAAADQPSKYDQRNRQYLAQRAANLTLALKILPHRCWRPGLCSFPFVCLLRWGVARVQIDTFTSG
uniref:Uncharacterized protein n=1 Tax=Anopheles coluzzii TaxID=1518534 RepID=A0A8W7PP93_ANOCL